MAWAVRVPLVTALAMPLIVPSVGPVDGPVGGAIGGFHWWVPWVEPLGGSTGGFYWWVPLVVPLVSGISGFHWWCHWFHSMTSRIPFLDVICPAPRDPTDAHSHGRKLSKALSIPHIPSLGMFADTALLSSAVLLSSQHNAHHCSFTAISPFPCCAEGMLRRGAWCHRRQSCVPSAGVSR